MATHVNVDNWVWAESARMFAGQLAKSGCAVNEWDHNRTPTPIDAQNVIRMQRDTFYSSAIVDISEGATVTLPDAGNRYMSLMVLNEGHYINAIYHDVGTYELTVDEFDTPYALLVLRTFVDPDDPEDVAAVHALQDQLVVVAASSKPYVYPGYDEDSRSATHKALLVLGEGIRDSSRFFGKKEDVDQTRHMIGAAVGWGGLPEEEAYYMSESEPKPVGRFTLTLRDVPFDGFWSLSIYNRDGFFEANPYNSNGANNVTAVADEDGTVTLNLAPEPDGPNPTA